MQLTQININNSPVMEYLINAVKISNVIETTDSVKLVLNVENLILKEMVERQLLVQIHDHYSKLYSKRVESEFIIESRQQSLLDFSNEPELTTGEHIKADESVTSTFKFKNKYELSKQFTFDNLIPTLENNFAIQSLQAVLDDKSLSVPFVLIKGPSGTGKSHLLHSAGWYALSQRANLKVKVISGDDFINDFQTAIFTKTTGSFRDKYRLKTDLLLIDDIQTIAKAKATQLELFNLMNDFSLSGKKIFFTSDCDLLNIDTLDDRLKSRFQSGLLLDLDLPCMDSKVKYFRTKLTDNQLGLSNDLQLRINQHFGTCYRSIEGIINRLAMLKKINGYLDSEAIEKMFPLKSKETIKNLSVDSIIEDTALNHHLKVSDIKGKSRTKVIFTARKEAILRLRAELNLTVSEIGRIFQKDHTTILNALKQQF